MELRDVDMARAPTTAPSAVSVGASEALRHAKVPCRSNADPTGSRPAFGPTYISLSSSTSSDAISPTQSVGKLSAPASMRGMVP